MLMAMGFCILYRMGWILYLDEGVEGSKLVWTRQTGMRMRREGRERKKCWERGNVVS